MIFDANLLALLCVKVDNNLFRLTVTVNFLTHCYCQINQCSSTIEIIFVNLFRGFTLLEKTKKCGFGLFSN